MSTITQKGEEILQEVGERVDQLEQHQTVTWMKKFVPIYLFHFLIALTV